MNNIDNKIKKLIKKNKKFLIAFSGGLDSSVLLYSLNKNNNNNNINIRAIHINHNMNKKSKKWENHCINICNKLNIIIIIKQIYNKNNKNIESIYREKRYSIYKKYLLNNEILLTAHHKNDQCETILLSLKRGSGLSGLSGIKKKILIKNKIIIRPLLNIEKKEIKKYAINNKIIWINDSSNNNIKFDRNFLRKIIIPKLLNRWPFFIKCIIRSAKICFNQNKLLEKLINKKFNKSLIKKNILNLKYLIHLSREEFFLIIRKWIKINDKKMLSYKLLKIIWINIINNKKIYFQMFFKEFIINKYKNKIYLINKLKKIKKKIKWKNIKKNIFLPNGTLYISENNKNNINNLVRKPKLNEKIYIKFNIKNYIKILGRKKKKIKKIWQEYKILPWERPNIPIIFYNNNIIMSPNLFITENAKPNKLSSWKINFKK